VIASALVVICRFHQMKIPCVPYLGQQQLNSNNINIMSQVDECSNPRWENLWCNGLRPGQSFDIVVPSPVLVQYLQQGLIPTGRALVPGCGRGYDVTFLAASDRTVLGLDISATAIAAATQRAQALTDGSYILTTVDQDGRQHFFVDGEEIPLDPRGVSIAPQQVLRFPHQVSFSTDNFFNLPSARVEDKFDFIYDYTFLCALNPSIRAQWAQQMSDLVRVDGQLLTIIYPIVEVREEGPPFKVSLQLYKDLLEPVGFECLELKELPSELCHFGRDGSADGSGFRSGVGRWKKL
jgi:methyl halide transferase